MVLNFLKNNLSIPENEAFEIEISLREGVNNAILHGNNSDSAKMVNIIFSWKKNFIRICISDENDSFVDIDSLGNRKESENLLSFSGRGILLMKNYMDSVMFKKNPKGITVIMEKSF